MRVRRLKTYTEKSESEDDCRCITDITLDECMGAKEICVLRIDVRILVIESRSGQCQDGGVDGQCESKEGDDCIGLDVSSLSYSIRRNGWGTYRSVRDMKVGPPDPIEGFHICFVFLHGGLIV
jgi:hypothetical protein